MDKLLLIDGNSLINRAYYAFGGGGALSHNGNSTNATYGFLNMFFKAVGDIKPKYIAVAFDMRAKTFRHKMYTEYKATRKGMPDDLAAQFDDLKGLLKTMGVTILECEGYEADDIIGTLSKASKHKAIILSADRDGLQLVDDCTELHLTKTGVTNLDVWSEDRIKTEYGLTPEQLIDLKALIGDKSDNVPGALGVGEKTALDLMREYNSLEKIYDNLENIRESLREKLKTSRDLVFLSRDLVRINTEVPCDNKIETFTFKTPMGKEIYDAFDSRGFKSLLKRPSLWTEDFYSEGTEIQRFSTENLYSEPPTQEETKVQTKTIEIKTLDELSALVKRLMNAELVASSWDADAIYLSADEATEYKIIKQVDLISGGFTYEQINSVLKPLHETKVPKALLDSKRLRERLATHGINLENVVLDANLCEHLITSETSFPQRKIPFKQFREYLQRLDSLGMLSLYKEIELPLVGILVEMQNHGAKVDLKALASVSENLQAQIAGLTAKIYEFAGENFNINSPQQLGEILFKKLGVETTRKTKTGWSTDEFELSKKAGSHPIVPQILRYRKVFKLYSTYIQGYKNLVDSNGFVHSTFHNTATVTGRFSSSEPNLQNIPTRSEDAEMIRKLFTSRFPGGKIIAADYNQIELRLLAHFSGDPVMKRAFTEGHDIHTETAMKVFDVTALQVTPDMRRKAKAVNFGIVYGQGAFGLSEQLGCSVSDAGRFIDKYFQEFAGVKSFLDKCRDEAIAKGYATTLFGRRRIIKELSSTNQQVVGFGLRAAVNMPMQGSASDIIKKAMVMLKGKLGHCLLIAQVHDELIFDCLPNEIETATKIIKETMESVTQLSVPLTVNIEVKETF